MNVISHGLKALLLIAAALAALWVAMTITSIETTGGHDENCPNSSLRFCFFVVV